VNTPINRPICDGLHPILLANSGNVGVSISKDINSKVLEINRKMKFFVKKDLDSSMFIINGLQ
jgi:hypothetical protein